GTSYESTMTREVECLLDGRNLGARREPYQLTTVDVEQVTGGDNEAAGLAFNKGREGWLEVLLAADFSDNEVQSERICRRKRVAQQLILHAPVHGLGRG